MFTAGRTFQEWAAMAPWQRDDLSERFRKREEEKQKQFNALEQQLQSQFSGLGLP
jgi:hypothetical protein